MNLLVAGVLALSACASGPSVSDDSEEPPVVEEQMSTESENAGQEAGTGDSNGSGTPAPIDDADPSSGVDEGELTLTSNPPKETTSSAPPDEPPEDNAQIDPSLLPFVEQATADLAERLSVGASTIVVVSAELVEWSDASLGCPQPDMVYMQVPTDGSLIILSHAGTEYRYHTGGSQYVPFLCE